MARVRFVQPKITRLHLVDVHRRRHQALLDQAKPATATELAQSAEAVAAAEADGAFIDVKHELTAGEERESFARMTKSLEAGKVAQLDPEQVQLATLVAYIVGWSFVDANDQPVEVSESAIKQLDSETFMEMYQAIEAHELAVAVQKKVNRVGATRSSATSSSPGA